MRDHQAFLASTDAKAHKIYHTSYQVPYTPARSHPGGAHVGNSYTEFFTPRTMPKETPTFQPQLVKAGYFKQRDDALGKQQQAERDAAERAQRIRARIAVCTLCDNAVRAGRSYCRE